MREGQKRKSRESLETVEAAFEEYRQRRLGNRALPEELWARAGGLLEAYPITQVCRELRLNSKRLSEQRARLQAKRILPEAAASAGGRREAPGFIAVSVGQIAAARRRAESALNRQSARVSSGAAEVAAKPPITPRPGPVPNIAANGAIAAGCSITVERADGWRLSLNVAGESNAGSNAPLSRVVEVLCARFFGTGGISEAGREVER